METQPAKKSYFFGKGYRDLWHTIRDAHNLNVNSAKKYWMYTEYKWQEGIFWRVVAVGSAFAALSVILFGTLFFATISLLHITILASVFSVIYISFSILWISDKGYRVWHHIFTACPNCHHKSELPHYVCPSCGSKHTLLIPSSYGIYHRRCQCGELLPTTFLNGREQLDALCPNCQTEIKTQESVPICIPITGGASVGKTCFLFSALHEFKDKIAPLHGWDVSFLEEQDEEKYSRTLTEFQQGAVPQKTVIGSQSSPTAFNFTISSHQWQTKKTVYFYDAAGESFQDTGILKHHGFYAFFHGMIFIIDPFSIPEIYDMYQNQLATYTNTDLKVSEILLEDTFDNMVVNLEKNFHVKREKHIKQPLAIVINKIDAFDLDKIIGQQAGRELMAKDASIQTLEEAIDQLCRQQFKLWELNNLLVKLEQKFTNYRFFTCSALGHLPMNNTAFQSYGAVEPLLWLLKQTDRKHFK